MCFIALFMHILSIFLVDTEGLYLPFYRGGVSCLTAGMPGGDYGELGGSLPAIASLNASYSTSLSLPSPYLLPPAERKAISDVRRTFCLFVTFDLLFISLLWIIELNVSVYFGRDVFRDMVFVLSATAVTG